MFFFGCHLAGNEMNPGNESNPKEDFLLDISLSLSEGKLSVTDTPLLEVFAREAKSANLRFLLFYFLNGFMRIDPVDPFDQEAVLLELGKWWRVAAGYFT